MTRTGITTRPRDRARGSSSLRRTIRTARGSTRPKTSAATCGRSRSPSQTSTPPRGEAPFVNLPARRDVPSATAAQMVEADRIASEELGIRLEVLMENAAHQVAVAARLFLRGVAGKRIVAFAGRGNNG